MGIMVMIAQLVLSLSILVILHEFGHYLPAKFFKTRVEKFYLFFDPWFSIFKKKIGETVYGIGWLPLGGYVKIAGMMDESMDKEQLKQPPKPWEFRSKPAWQRLVIMLGGVTVNFILGFLLFGMVLFIWGDKYLATEDVDNGIAVEKLGAKLGFQDGDKVLSVGNVEFDEFNDRLVFKQVVLHNAESAKVIRNGEKKTITFPDSATIWLSDSENAQKPIYLPRMPYKIYKVKNGTPADKAGLKKDDKVIAVNGKSIQYFDQFDDIVDRQPNTTFDLKVKRGDEIIKKSITTNDDGLIGTYNYGVDYFYDLSIRKYTLAEAIPAGVSKGYNFLADQITAFQQMFRGNIKASDSLGGFVSITKLFPQTWDWKSFWTITAILSLILGFMNLLPIPALDGGHVMFLLWEVVTGRKPSDKFMEYATLAGFIIIIALLLYANGLDIMRLMD